MGRVAHPFEIHFPQKLDMDGAEITAGLGTNDEGINFFDTAMKYGPQDAVGQGLEGLPRDDYILSTKLNFVNKADGSLRALRTDYMDIYSRASFSISISRYVSASCLR